MPAKPRQSPRDAATVMVSRSFSDYEEHRVELIKAIESVGLKPAAVGHYELTTAGAIEASLKLIQSCGALALIIGEKYGSVPGDLHSNPLQRSFGELEFDEAARLDLPVLAFMTPEYAGVTVKDLKDFEQLEAFRKKVKSYRPTHQFGLTYHFRTLDEFRVLATKALAEFNLHLQSQSETTRLQEQEAAGFGADSSRRSTSTDDPSPRDREAVSSEKPLVFISASDIDSEWRILLERRLDQYKEDIDWWDDSKLETGMGFEDQLDSARSRANIAVLLLSPDYLNSKKAKAEMAILSAREKSKGGLRLLPIVVRDCEWHKFTEINAARIWDKGRPLDQVASRKSRSAEIQKIADNILKLIGKEEATPSPPIDNVDLVNLPTPPDTRRFSANAQLIVDKANSLAKDSGRNCVTSSCLLFAFSESEVSRDHPVAKAMLACGQYSTVFKSFLLGSDRSARSNPVETSMGLASKNVASVIRYAEKVAFRVSSEKTIHRRHLLAALLNPPGLKGKLGAHGRLKAMGLARSAYLGELLQFILESEPDDDRVVWESVLAVGPKPSPKPTPKSIPLFQEGPAGYTAEFCGVGGERTVADYLFVSAHADRLAELIALKETKLPLAIGLFGNWGSGKSHFMNLIDRRLKALMKEEEERARSSNPRPKWCREIVPIYFNAWHYLDTNLWASLVGQIFESLFTHLSPRANELEQMQKLLAEASGAAARAAEELAVAQKATEQAKKDLSVAEQNRLQAETVVDGLLHGLGSLLPEVTLKEVQKQSGELLGIEKEIRTIDDLRQVAEEAASLRTRSWALWNKLWKRPGRGWRIASLIAMLLGGAGIAAFTTMYLPGLKDWLQPVGRAIATVLGGISALVISLGPTIAAAGKRLRQVEEWAGKAETEQRRLRETDEVKEATLKRAATTAREEAARSQLAEAQSRENQLKEEASSLSPGRKLGRYIEERAQSSDYRGQLGLVSLARRDFQELSNLFADAQAVQERVANVRLTAKEKEKEEEDLRESQAGKEEAEAKRIKDEADRCKAEASQLKDEATRIEELSKCIDRIVLFVDDLDRCQPEKIVEILQAVHLLLAFPLFAVVVGVDQRALRQSLRMQFKGLLSQNGERAQADDARRGSQDPVERAATPLDYLEKIFHVPFHLPVMGKDGFERLIDRLTAPMEVDAQTELSERNDGFVHPKSDERMSLPKVDAPPVIFTIPSDVPPPFRPDVPAVDVPLVMGKEGPTIATEQLVESELIGSVPLQNWEREALRDYHTLIQTPRGAKRLLNTYRLVRAGVPKQEWDSFAAGEYRVAMLLLAAAAGYPATAREWFAELMKPGAGTILADDNAGDVSSGWNDFKKLYRGNRTMIVDNSAADVLTKWVSRVETFTF